MTEKHVVFVARRALSKTLRVDGGLESRTIPKTPPVQSLQLDDILYHVHIHGNQNAAVAPEVIQEALPIALDLVKQNHQREHAKPT